MKNDNQLYCDLMEFVENRFPDIAAKYFDFVGKPPSKYEWLDILLEGGQEQ